MVPCVVDLGGSSCCRYWRSSGWSIYVQSLQAVRARDCGTLFPNSSAPILAGAVAGYHGRVVPCVVDLGGSSCRRYWRSSGRSIYVQSLQAVRARDWRTPFPDLLRSDPRRYRLRIPWRVVGSVVPCVVDLGGSSRCRYWRSSGWSIYVQSLQAVRARDWRTLFHIINSADSHRCRRRRPWTSSRECGALCC